jgi:cell division protein FtsN
LLIISPRKDFGSPLQEQSAVIEPPNLTQGWESVKEPEQRSGETVIADSRADQSAYITPVQPMAVEQSNVTTLSIPAPRSAAVPDVVVSPVQAARTRQAPVQAYAREATPKEVKYQAAAKAAATPAAKSVAVKPAAKPVEKPAAAKPTENPAVSPAAKTAASPAEKPKTSKTYDNPNFWIQTGAFSTMKHAEGAKDYLAARGITSIIEDPVINGRTWYRVRVGPYTTRDEANYWLALVKSIDGFSASQVWETAAR